MAVCHLAAEMGARFGYVEPDGVALRYLSTRARDGFEPVFSDADADVEQTISVDISSLVPQVASPDAPASVVEVGQVAGQPIQQAVLGTMASGRVEDLWAAVNLLRGRKIHRGVRLLVFPASSRVYADALRLGLVADLVDCGAVIMNPGCGRSDEGLCPDEVCISTASRPGPGVYLASPQTVAASALAGRITDPRGSR
jgi:homoaconitase/3-isopropylmalate dehydratase large subunit